jgi:hypothetical protein
MALQPPIGMKFAFAYAGAGPASARQQQTNKDARTAKNVFFFSKTGGSGFDPTYYRPDGSLKSDAEFYNAAFNALPPEVRMLRANAMEQLRMQLVYHQQVEALKAADPLRWKTDDELTPWERFLRILK